MTWLQQDCTVFVVQNARRQTHKSRARSSQQPVLYLPARFPHQQSVRRDVDKQADMGRKYLTTYNQSKYSGQNLTSMSDIALIDVFGVATMPFHLLSVLFHGT